MCYAVGEEPHNVQLFPDTTTRLRGHTHVRVMESWACALSYPEGGGAAVAREKKYKTDTALRRAVEGYFDSISRTRTVMEAYNTGEKDAWGHFVQELREVRNDAGAAVTEREFVIPPTVGGLCAFLGISRETWARYCDGEENPQFRETARWAREQLLAWREKELLTRPGKDVKGVLFDLQVNYGMNERINFSEQSGGGVQILDDL